MPQVSAALVRIGLVLSLFSACYLSHEPAEPLGDPPPLVDPPPRPLDLCAFTSGSESDYPTPLVFIVGEQLMGLDPAGHAIVLHVFGTPTRISQPVIVTRGDFAGAGVTWFEGEPPYDSVWLEFVLVDLQSRETIAHLLEEVSYENWGPSFRLRGNARGTFVFSQAAGNYTHFGILSPERSGLLALENFEVLTDPDEFSNVGVQRVRNIEPGESRFRWLDLNTLELTRAESDHVFPGGGSRVYGTAGDGLFLLGARESEQLAPGDHVGRPLRRFTSGRLLVAGASLGDAHISYSLQGEPPVEFDIQVPTGLRRMRDSGGRIRVNSSLAPGGIAPTSDGSLVYAFRNAERAQVYTTRDGGEWAPIGQPMGYVVDAYGAEVDGTYILSGDANATSDLIGSWPDGIDGRIDGPSVQIVRPASGVSVVTENPGRGVGIAQLGYVLTPDGTCVASLRGTNLYVLSMSTGAEMETDFPEFIHNESSGFHVAWAVESRRIEAF